jgi:hypothetical protein
MAASFGWAGRNSVRCWHCCYAMLTAWCLPSTWLRRCGGAHPGGPGRISGRTPRSGRSALHTHPNPARGKPFIAGDLASRITSLTVTGAALLLARK